MRDETLRQGRPTADRKVLPNQTLYNRYSVSLPFCFDNQCRRLIGRFVYLWRCCVLSLKSDLLASVCLIIRFLTNLQR